MRAFLPALAFLLATPAFAQPADTTATTVVGIATTTAPYGGGARFAAGEVVEFTVTFSKTVRVASDTAPPTLAFHIGAARRTALYAWGSDSAELVFSYGVASGDSGTITVAADALRNPGAITDMQGNAFAGALPALTAGQAGAVDSTAVAPPIRILIKNERLLPGHDDSVLFAAGNGRELSESVSNDSTADYSTVFKVHPLFRQRNLNVYLRGIRLAPTSEVSLADLSDQNGCTSHFLSGDGSTLAAAYGGRFPADYYWSGGSDADAVLNAPGFSPVECRTRADALLEGLETMVWEIEYASSADEGAPSHVVRSVPARLYDADRATVELGAMVASEVEEGATFRLPIHLSRPAMFDVFVRWQITFPEATDGDPAAGAADFVNGQTEGVARIPAGETQGEALLEVLDEGANSTTDDDVPERALERFEAGLVGVYEDAAGTVAVREECASSVSQDNVPMLTSCVELGSALSASAAIRGLPSDAAVTVTGGAGLTPESASSARFTARDGTRVTLSATSTGLMQPVAWRWSQSTSDTTQVLNDVETGANSLTFDLPLRIQGYVLTFTVTAMEPGGDFVDTLVTIDAVHGICDRTPAVRVAILGLLPGVSDCAAVTSADLAAIEGGISLRYQNLERLQAFDFAGLTSLGVLALSSNRLSTLPDGIFADLGSLTRLHLNANRFTELPAGFFGGVGGANGNRLELLEFRNNDLRTLSEDAFDGMTALEELDLGNNELSTLPSGLLDDLTQLTSLELDHNRLGSLPAGFFTPLAGGSGLQYLDLTSNPGNLSLTATLEKAEDIRGVVARIAEGAPAALTLTLNVNGTPETVAFPAGADRVTHPVTAPVGATVSTGGEITGLPWPDSGLDLRVPSQSVVLADRILVSVRASTNAAQAGELVTFTLVANEAPESNLRIALEWTTFADGTMHSMALSGTIPAGDTEDDAVSYRFESGSWAMLRVMDDDDYDVGSPASAVVSQRRDTGNSTAAGIGTSATSVKEGATATFTVSIQSQGGAQEDDGSGVSVNVELREPGRTRTRVVRFRDGFDEVPLSVAVRADDERFQGNQTLLAIVKPGTGYVVGAPAVAVVTVWDDEETPDRIALSVSPEELTESAGETSITVSAEISGGAPLAEATQVDISLSHSGRAGMTVPPESFAIQIAAGEKIGTSTFLLNPVERAGWQGNGTVTISGANSRLPVEPVTLRVPDTFEPEVAITAGASLAAEASAPDGALRYSADEGALVILTASSVDSNVPVSFAWSQAPDDAVRLLDSGVATGTARLSLTLPNRSLPYTLRLTAVATHTLGGGEPARTAERAVLVEVAADDDPLTLTQAVAEAEGKVFSDGVLTVTVGDEVTLRGAASEPDADQSLTLAWSGPSELPLTLPDPQTPEIATFTAPAASGKWTFTFTANDGVATSISREVTVAAVGTVSVTGSENLTPEASGAPGVTRFTVSENRTVTLTAVSSDFTGEVTWRWVQAPADATRVLENAAGSSHELTLDLPERGEDYALTLAVTATEAGVGSASALVRIAVTSPGGICARRRVIRDAILAAIDNVSDCAAVTAEHLGAIGEGSALNLRNKRIEQLRPSDFAGLIHLEALDLQNNRLSSLPSGVFSDLVSLRTLNLSDNNLFSLSSGAFSGLTLLETLNLSGNDRLWSLPSGLFSDVTSLRTLNLRHNRLQTLPPGVFSETPLLNHIDLRNNHLSSLPSGIFSGLHLDYLNLIQNGFNRLPEGLFLGLTYLHQFRFRLNPEPFDREHSFTVLPEALDDERGVRVHIAEAVPATTTITLMVGDDRHDLVMPTGGYEVAWRAPEYGPELSVTLEAGAVGRPPGGANGVDFNFSSRTLTLPARISVEINSTALTPETPSPDGALRYSAIEGARVMLTAMVAGSDAPFSFAWAQVPEDEFQLLDSGVATGTAALSFRLPNRSRSYTLRLMVAARHDSGGGAPVVTTSRALLVEVAADDDPLTITQAVAEAGGRVSSDGALTVTVGDEVTLRGATNEPDVDQPPTLAWSGPSGILLALPDPAIPQVATFTPSASGKWTFTFTAQDDIATSTSEVTVTAVGTVSVVGGENLIPQESGSTDMVRFIAGKGRRATLTAASSGFAGEVTWRWTQAPADLVPVLSAVGSSTNPLTLDLPDRSEDYALTLTVAATQANIGTATATAMLAVRTGICSRTPAVRHEILNQLERLGISDCAAVTAVDLAQVTVLLLAYKDLEQLQAFDFAGLTGLQQLILEGNRLTTLPEGIFADLESLQILNLSGNRFTELPPGTFAGAGEADGLGVLDLSRNRLESLSRDVFADTTELAFLDLEDNEIGTLPPDLLEGQTELNYLDLSSNRIERLPEGLFTPLSGSEGLGTLRLGSNPKDAPRPVRLTVMLEKAGNGSDVVVRLAEGAPVTLTLTLDVDGASHTVVIPAGATEVTIPLAVPAGAIVTLQGEIEGLPSDGINENGEEEGFEGLDYRVTSQSVVLANSLLVSVAAVESVVTDPRNVRFVLTASEAPRSDLTVELRALGSYADDIVRSEMVTIPAGETTVTWNAAGSSWASGYGATTEENLALVAMVVQGAGYDVGLPAGAAVTVQDADASGRLISIEASAASVREGGSVRFTLRTTQSSPSIASAGIGVVAEDSPLSPDSNAFEGGQNIFQQLFGPNARKTAFVRTVRAEDDRFQGNRALAIFVRDRADHGAGTPAVAVVTVWDDERPPERVALSLSPEELTEGAGETSLTLSASLSGGAPLAETAPIEFALSYTGRAGPPPAPERFTLEIAAGERSGVQTFRLTPSADDGTYQGDGKLVASGTHPWLRVDPVTLWVLDTSEPEITITLDASLSAQANAPGGALRYSATEDTRVALTAGLAGSDTPFSFAWSQASDDAVQVLDSGVATGTAQLSLALPNRSLPYALRLMVTATHDPGDGGPARSAERVVLIDVAADNDPPTITRAGAESGGEVSADGVLTVTVGDEVTLRGAAEEPDIDQIPVPAWSGPSDVPLTLADPTRPQVATFTAPEASGKWTFTFTATDGAATSSARVTVAAVGTVSVGGGANLTPEESATPGVTWFTANENQSVTLTAASSGFAGEVAWHWTQAPTDLVRMLDAAGTTTNPLTLDLPGRSGDYALTFTVTATEAGLGAASATVMLTVLDGICARTPAVRQAILAKLQNIDDCAAVTDADLAAIGGTLSLLDQEAGQLRVFDFEGLTSIATLDLRGNRLERLPAGLFAGLISLRSIVLENNRLTALPAGVFAGLEALTQLDLSWNQFTQLPAGFLVNAGITPSGLLSLDLQSNGFGTLPENLLHGMTNLQVLHLGNNRLTALPSGLFRDQQKLQRLDLGFNRLATLPAGIFAGLESLTQLQLDANRFTEPGPGFLADAGVPSGLHILGLWGNGFSALPENLFHGLAELRTLHLGNNELSALPSGLLRDQQYLEYLTLNDNRLERLPERFFTPFAGKGGLVNLALQSNPKGAPRPVPLTLTLDKTEDNRHAVVRVAEGAPTALTLTLDIAGASQTVVVPPGATRAMHPAPRGATVTLSGEIEGRARTRFTGLDLRVPTQSVTLSDRIAVSITAPRSLVTSTADLIFIVRASEAPASELTINLRVQGTRDDETADVMATMPAGATTTAWSGDGLFSAFRPYAYVQPMIVAVMGGDGYEVGLPATAVVTLDASDPPADRIEISFEAPVARVREGGQATFVLRLSPAPSQAVGFLMTQKTANLSTGGEIPAVERTYRIDFFDFGTPDERLAIFSEGVELPADGFVTWDRAESSFTLTVDVREDDDRFQGRETIALLRNWTCPYCINERVAASPSSASAVITVLDDEQPPDEVALSVFPDEVTEGDGPTPVTVQVALSGGDPLSFTTKVELALSLTGQSDFTLTAPESLTLEIEPGERSASVTFTVTPPTHYGAHQGEGAVVVSGAHAWLPVATTTLRLLDTAPAPSPELLAAVGTVSVTGSENLTPQDSPALRNLRFAADENQRVTLTAASSGSSDRIAWHWTQSDRDAVRALEAAGTSSNPLTFVLPHAYVEDYTLTFTLTATEPDLGSIPHIVTIAVANLDGICDRTPVVRTAILAAIDNVDDCAAVTAAHLRGIGESSTLRLNGKGIEQLQPHDFAGLTQLGRLQLSSNNLSSLPAGVFSDLTSLRTLYLNNNHLSSLPAEAFSGLTSLNILYLNNNRLSSLPVGVFSGLTSLTKLYLNGNSLPSLIAGVFSELSSLEQLYLHGNLLSSLPAGIFSGLTALERLNIQDNALSSLPSDLFRDQQALSILDLAGNRLERLPAGFFTPLAGGAGLGTLDLGSNPSDNPRPLPLTVTLERAGENRGVVARIAEGAPAALTLTLDVDGTSETVAFAAGADHVTHPVAAPAGVTVSLQGEIGGLPAANFIGLDRRVPSQSVVLTDGILVSVGTAADTVPAGMVNFTLTVTRAPPSDIGVDFQWIVASGAAYRETISTYRETIPAGEKEIEVSYPMSDSDRWGILRVVAGNGYGLGAPPAAAVTRQRDTGDSIAARIETSARSVKEGAQVRFPMFLGGGGASQGSHWPNIDVSVEIRLYEGAPSSQPATSWEQVARFRNGSPETLLPVDARLSDDRYQGNGSLIVIVRPGSGHDAGAPAVAVVTMWDDELPPDRIALRVSPKEVKEDAGATPIGVSAELVGGAPLAETAQVGVSLTRAGRIGTELASESFTVEIAAGETRSATSTFLLTPVADKDTWHRDDEAVTVSGTHSWLRVDSATVRVRDVFEPEVRIAAGATLSAQGDASDGTLRYRADEDTLMTLIASSTSSNVPATFAWSQAPGDAVRVLDSGVATGTAQLSLALPNRSQAYTLRFTATAAHTPGGGAPVRIAERAVLVEVAADDDPPTITLAVAEAGGEMSSNGVLTVAVGDAVTLRGAVNEPDVDQSPTPAWSGPPDITLMLPDPERPEIAAFTAPDTSGVWTFTFTAQGGVATSSPLTSEVAVVVLGAGPFVTGSANLISEESGLPGVARFTADESTQVTLTAASPVFSDEAEWSWTQDPADAAQVLENVATGTRLLTLNLPGWYEEYTLNLTVTAMKPEIGSASSTVRITVRNLNGICDRTESVRDAILALLDEVSNCAEVTRAHLHGIGADSTLTLASVLGSKKSEQLQPWDFEGLINLGALDLQDNYMTSLPAGVFSGLSSLRTLNLYNNRLRSLSSGVFSGLTSLTTLRLDLNPLWGVPADVFRGLTSLETLRLDNNRLLELSPELFSGLASLRILRLGDNRLSPLPSGVFSGLASLTTLDLHGNIELTSLPADVFQGLASLEALDLSGNSLSFLPSELFSGLASLQTLDLDNNQLSSLSPGVFSGLDSLSRINLRNNLLSSLPPGTFEGLDLVEIALERNQFKQLPEGLFLRIGGLDEFRFGENPGSRSGEGSGSQSRTRTTASSPPHSFTVTLEALDHVRGVRVQIVEAVPATTTLALMVAGERLELVIPVGGDEVRWLAPEFGPALVVVLEAGEVGQPSLGSTGVDYRYASQTLTLPGQIGISIAASTSSVEAGQVAQFIVTADPAPSRAVELEVELSGGVVFGVPNGRRPVTLEAGATTATLSVLTRAVDRVGGSVVLRATLVESSGFVVREPAAAEMSITSDGVLVSIVALDDVVKAGELALFFLVSDGTLLHPLNIRMSLTGDVASEEAGPRSVTLEEGGFGWFYARAADSLQGNGAFIATLQDGEGYTPAVPVAAAVAVEASATTTPDESARVRIEAPPLNEVLEGHFAVFTLTLADGMTATSSFTVAVDVSGAGLPAAADAAGIRTVLFTAGEGEVELRVPVRAYRPGVQPDEAVQASVRVGKGYAVGLPSTAVVTVVNDDDPVPDVNQDGTVDVRDALILYYALSLRESLGNGR